jgi:hypothetical protein
MAPTDAATLYGAPIQENTTAASYPSIRSEWFAGSNNFPAQRAHLRSLQRRLVRDLFPLRHDDPLLLARDLRVRPEARRAVSRRIAGGQPGRAPLARWRRVAERRRVRQRQQKPNVSRAASRHLQGYGYKFDSTALQVTHDPTESGLAAVPGSGNASTFASGATTSGRSRSGARRARCRRSPAWNSVINAAGQLALTNITSAGTRFTIKLSAAALPIGVWKKIDHDLHLRHERVLPLVRQRRRSARGSWRRRRRPRAGRRTSGTVSIGPGVVNGLTFDMTTGAAAPSRPTRRSAARIRPTTARRSRSGRSGRTIGKTAAASRRSARSASAPITPPAAWTGDWRLLRQRPSGNITTERVVEQHVGRAPHDRDRCRARSRQPGRRRSASRDGRQRVQPEGRRHQRLARLPAAGRRRRDDGDRAAGGPELEFRCSTARAIVTRSRRSPGWS